MTKKSFYFNSWLIVLIATIAAFINLAFRSQISIATMYQLEFVKSEAMFRSILVQHGITDEWMEQLIYKDYLFIVCFTLLFYLSIKVLTYSSKRKRRSFLGVFSIIAGFFAAVQNLLILEIVNHQGLKRHFEIYEVVVWSKWIAVMPFIMIVLAACRIQILRLFKKIAATSNHEESI